ncbi:Arylsulfatase A [Arachidicoccus rhizosphaerae]|uniref:Arylsulfatase A n=1 Tax=Arachidicoccus rhizosphaerae TaxID=551991 RepID=A0A1H4ASK3_9BACT|nr:arylsulfatase [Arachidicoccus rhizosphaerae]SEA38757.1 Arylsulfatase A [Arachidicoccus rhizosphaerae]
MFEVRYSVAKSYRNGLLRQSLTLFGLLGLALYANAQSGPTDKRMHKADKQRPNIVFLLADDLGFGDVGFNGQSKIRTPNLDALAKDGKMYTHFYAGTSICAPSRSTLLTGQHTGHTYIRGNKSVEPEGQEPLPKTGKGLFDLLHQAGYHTAAFGKWGLGYIGSTGDPLQQGLDHFYGYNSQSLAHRYYPDHLWDDDKRVEITGNAHFTKQVVYAPDLIQQKALDYIDQQSEDTPFFLFLPYILPHAELYVPDDSIFESYKGRFTETPYKGKDYGLNAIDHGYASQQYPHAAFAAMVTRLDLYLGQIREKLKEKGLDKNTIIVFTSDNGPHIEGGADPEFFDSNGPFRGVKRDLFEGGIREPFLISWPGKIKPATVSNHVSTFWDLYPTFISLAGSKQLIPANIDGISMVDDLVGKSGQKSHDYLYFELHEQGGKQAVVKGDWKAIRLHVDKNPNGPLLLYDLKKDPGETKDLSGQYPEIVKQMEGIMKEAHTPSALFPFKGE